jgi:hypothetical protein
MIEARDHRSKPSDQLLEQCVEAFPFRKSKRRQDSLLVRDMAAERFVNPALAYLGKRDQLTAAVVGIGTALDEPGALVNLPVRDLTASTKFYIALGGTLNPQFSNDQASSIMFSDAIGVMLLTHDHYRQFTQRPIGDARHDSQAMIALTAERVA